MEISVTFFIQTWVCFFTQTVLLALRILQEGSVRPTGSHDCSHRKQVKWQQVTQKKG